MASVRVRDDPRPVPIVAFPGLAPTMISKDTSPPRGPPRYRDARNAPDFPYFSGWRRIALGEVRQCFPCGRCRDFPYTDQITESLI
jgi:hypothetical protein